MEKSGIAKYLYFHNNFLFVTVEQRMSRDSKEMGQQSAFFWTSKVGGDNSFRQHTHKILQKCNLKLWICLKGKHHPDIIEYLIRSFVFTTFYLSCNKL